MKTLEQLLRECDQLWSYDEPIAYTFNYTLGRFPGGWQFSVTNDWYKWNDAGLKHTFGVYTTASGAIRAFLNYVRENKIDVRALAHTTTAKEYEEITKRHWTGEES